MCANTLTCFFHFMLLKRKVHQSIDWSENVLPNPMVASGINSALLATFSQSPNHVLKSQFSTLFMTINVSVVIFGVSVWSNVMLVCFFPFNIILE